MDGSNLGTGFMAVFAVSGSVVFLAMQAHKRLLSNFMQEMEFQIRNSTGVAVKNEPKKKVRFADEAVESTAVKGCRKGYMSRARARAAGRNNDDENLECMPQNWQIMYKQMLQCRSLRGYN